MESKRAGQLQQRFREERAAGSVLTGPRMSGTGLAAAWEARVMQSPDIRVPIASVQNRLTGVIAFTIGYSTIGDGAKII